MNTDKAYAKKIASEYAPQETRKVVALRKLDFRAKLPASLFAYTFGVLMALVLGVGMCLSLNIIGDGSTTFMILGIVIGIVGIAGVTVNDPDTGETLTLHFSEGSYNVRLLAFRASDGTTYQFAQPRYELYDPNLIGEYLYKSARSYIPEIDEDDAGIDISGNENAKDWKDAIAEYVQAVENNDSSAVSAMMDLSSVPDLIKTLTPMVNKPRTAEELTGYFFSFWKNALNEQYGALTEKYGKGFRIAYEILNMEEIGGERLDSINRQLQEYSDTAAEYLGIVSLTVRYTVSGSLGSGMEKESFLTPVLVLFQTENGWTLGTGNGFPNPDTEELVEFFGGLRKQ